jgi:hypothetical protein
MVGAVITGEQLWTALHHALARVHEFDDLTAKLGEFGLNADDVHDVLLERWQQYPEGRQPAITVFVRGFVEGLLTGLQLNVRHE